MQHTALGIVLVATLEVVLRINCHIACGYLDVLVVRLLSASYEDCHLNTNVSNANKTNKGLQACNPLEMSIVLFTGPCPYATSVSAPVTESMMKPRTVTQKHQEIYRLRN